MDQSVSFNPEELIVSKAKNQTHTEVFLEVYEKNLWKDPKFSEGGGSGGGSDPEYCKKYLEWLPVYLKENNIKSILDLGCGDFRVASHYYKSVDRYYGVDVVQRYPKKLKFNFLESDFSVPSNLASVFEWCGSVDLVIIKDVLMHWTDEEIETFLKAFKKQPWRKCVITNRWRYVRRPELNGTPRNPRSNSFTSSPLPCDHESLKSLPFNVVMYYPSKNSIQVCECTNPKAKK